MARICKIYTKQGDQGETRLSGGERIRKDAVRIRAYGTVDELNSVIGIALAFDPAQQAKSALLRIQHELFILGGELSLLHVEKAKRHLKTIEPRHVDALETLIDTLTRELPPLDEFILPGGRPTAAFLHQARCVCRRAETLVVRLAKEEATGENMVKYLNRLSDALFVLARYENHQNGVQETTWRKLEE